MSAVEEAHAFRKYIYEFGWGGIADLAQSISRSSSYISRRIKLLELPQDILELISYSDIYPSVAEEILSVKGNDRQTELAIMIHENELSLRDTRKLLKNCLKLGSTDRYEDSFLDSSRKEFDIRKYFDKLIISLRMVLSDVAVLINEAENDWILREILMQHRNMINNQIDLLIRQKKKSARKIFLRLRN